MASEIKVDTIVNAGGDNDTGIDLATNDQILLKVANATKLTMNSTGQTTIVGEGGTTTTSVQQGLVKHWIHFDGTDSTPAADDSFNHSSLTDAGTGAYESVCTNNMANVEYAAFGFANDQNYGNGSQSTSTLRFENRNDAGNASSDTNRISMGMFGDLA